MFINDLVEFDNCYLYADDCLVMEFGETPIISTQNLERSLIKYSKWYHNNLLVLNASKTDVVTFSFNKLNKENLPDLIVQDKAIKQSDSIKYLGMYLDNKLNFKKNLSILKQKLFPVIQNFGRNRKYINDHIAATWYKQLIRPILEYGAPIIHCSNNYIKKEILAIENRCLKIINKGSKASTRLNHNIPLINYRIKYLFLVAFFKFSHQLVPTIDETLLPDKPTSLMTRLSTTGGFLLGKSSNRIMHIGITQFNSLPPDVRASTVLKDFKLSLKQTILIFDSSE
jgi:hypothetical protein